MKQRPGIRTKVQAIIATVILIPGIAIGSYLYLHSQQLLTSLIRGQHQGFFFQITQRIDQLFSACLNDLSHVAALPLLEDYRMNRRYGLHEEAAIVRERLQQHFEEILRRSPAYRRVIFRTTSGHVLVDATTHEAVDSEELVVLSSSSVPFDEQGFRFVDGTTKNLPVHAYEAMIRRDRLPDQTVGIVSIVLHTPRIATILDSATEAPGGGTFRLLSADDVPVIYGISPNARGDSPWDADFSARLVNGWHLQMFVDYDYLLTPLDSFRRRSILVLLLTFLLGLVLSAMAARRISRPLIDMASLSSRIAGGDFTVPDRDTSSMDLEVYRLWDNLSAMAVSLDQGRLRLESHITELKTTQNQLIHAEKLSALGLLVAGVAHELNNPISGLIASRRIIDRALEGETPNKSLALKHVALMHAQLDHMSTIVTALRDYSRFSESKPRINLDINRIVEDGLIIVGHHVKKMVLHLSLRASTPVAGDPVSLKQVLVNLIVNAVEASPPTGHLYIRTWDDVLHDDDIYFSGYARRRRDDDTHDRYHQRRLLDGALKWTRSFDLEPGSPCVCLTVRDEGCGIPDEVFRRIFDPFFTTKPEGQGTGLGLSVVLGIVESHQGIIRVESTPSEGATFTIKFPAARETKTKEGETPQ